MKSASYIIIFMLFLISCGNPAIVRYFKPRINIAKDAAIKNNYKFAIYHTNGVTIYMQNITARDIELAAKNDTSENIEFRIPPLTYLQFEIENNSDRDFNINLFNITIEDSEGIDYPVIPETALSTRFTSVAYSNFKYNRVFSFYVNRLKGALPKKGNYFTKYSPVTEATIQPGYSGSQIIPFEFIPEKNLDFNLYLSLPGQEQKVVIPVEYVVYRSDLPLKR